MALQLAAFAFEGPGKSGSPNGSSDDHDIKGRNVDELAPNSGVVKGRLLSERNIPILKHDPQLGNLVGRGLSFTTGEVHYPTPYVLHGLGLGNLADKKNAECIRSSSNYKEIYSEGSGDKKLPSLDDLKGKNVLSIGEGYSGLVPYFRRHGVRAVGLDLENPYSVATDKDGKSLPTDRGNTHLERYKNYLLIGNALKLNETITGDSQDLILSHAVFSFFKRRENAGLEATSGGFAALRKGGSLYFNLDGTDDDSKKTEDGKVIELVKKWTRTLPKGSFELSILRGTNSVKGAGMGDAKECYRPDTISRKEFERDLSKHQAFQKREGNPILWPNPEEKDNIVIILRKK